MPQDLSAIVLSGGSNSRMNGVNKSFLKFGGTTFLELLLQILRPFFAEILLVTREPHLYENYRIKVVTDIYSKQCSLTGIHAGLSHAAHEQAFITACDTPLLKSDLLSLLIQNTSPGDDVVVPKHKEFYEPLCAIYSRNCIRYIEHMLSEDNLKIIDLYNYVRLREIRPEQLKTADPNLESFININNPRDLEWLNSCY